MTILQTVSSAVVSTAACKAPIGGVPTQGPSAWRYWPQPSTDWRCHSPSAWDCARMRARYVLASVLEGRQQQLRHPLLPHTRQVKRVAPLIAAHSSTDSARDTSHTQCASHAAQNAEGWKLTQSPPRCQAPWQPTAAAGAGHAGSPSPWRRRSRTWWRAGTWPSRCAPTGAPSPAGHLKLHLRAPEHGRCMHGA